VRRSWGNAPSLARLHRLWRHVALERSGYWFADSLSEPVARHPVAATGPIEEFFDPNVTGPGVFKWSHYFDIYHRHLAKFQGREVHVLEIGVYSGGSLHMWHHYFGPGCLVYGVDIEPACKAYESERTRVFIGDQASSDFWAEFIEEVPRIDVVIDDGGHEPRQQIATLEALLPHISPGGVYLCEDIRVDCDSGFHDYVAGLGRNLHRTQKGSPGDWTTPQWVPANPFQRLVDSIHLYPFVAVIELRTAAIDTFSCVRRGTQWLHL
jgi:hypothetical protein